jgi:hypothetical protein
MMIEIDVAEAEPGQTSPVWGDFEAWLSSQEHRADNIGELARQLNRGDVSMGDLPPALRPAASSARVEWLSGGPILAGADVSVRVATIREAAGLRKVSA